MEELARCQKAAGEDFFCCCRRFSLKWECGGHGAILQATLKCDANER